VKNNDDIDDNGRSIVIDLSSLMQKKALKTTFSLKDRTDWPLLSLVSINAT